jgi:hypothetical protein
MRIFPDGGDDVWTVCDVVNAIFAFTILGWCGISIIGPLF